jgi:hypothetical protein
MQVLNKKNGDLPIDVFLNDGSHDGWVFAVAQVVVVSGSAAVPRPAASSLMPLLQTPQWPEQTSALGDRRVHSTNACGR